MTSSGKRPRIEIASSQRSLSGFMPWLFHSPIISGSFGFLTHRVSAPILLHCLATGFAPLHRLGFLPNVLVPEQVKFQNHPASVGIGLVLNLGNHVIRAFPLAAQVVSVLKGYLVHEFRAPFR